MHTLTRTLSLTLWLVPISELGLLLWMIWYGTPDVPMVDEWFYVDQLKQWDAGTLSLASMLSFHNEHRIFVSRLIDLPLILATGWNRQLAMMVNLSVAIACALFLYACLRRCTPTLARRPAIVALLAAIFFSPAPAYNYIMPFQIAFFTTALGAAITAWALSSTLTWRSLCLALGGGILASLSIAGGLVVWPAFLVILVWRAPLRWPLWGVWSLSGAALITWYFSETPAAETVLPHIIDPTRNTMFALAYLGGPFAYPHATQAMLFGALVIALITVNLAMVWRAHGSLDMVLPWAGIALFAGLTAGVTAYGRTVGGLDLALSPYRQTLSLLAWVSAAVLAAVALESKALRAVPSHWRWGAITVNVLAWSACVLCSWPAVNRAVATADFALQVREQACIVDWDNCPQDIRTIYTYGSPADPDYLRARRLSIFRHNQE